MIEFVGWADEKGEGQPRANEMRGVFVRGRMQQFRVNSEQRMLVLTDSQQEGQIRSSCPSFPQVKTIQDLGSARSMTFERTKGRANGWAAQILVRATEVSTNKAAPTRRLRCPTGCPRETEGRKLRISLFCPPTVTREEEDKYLGSLCAWNPVSRRSPAPPVFAQGIPHPRLLRATHRNPPAAVGAAQLRNWKNVWFPFCAFGRPVGRLLALRGRPAYRGCPFCWRRRHIFMPWQEGGGREEGEECLHQPPGSKGSGARMPC